MEAKVAAFQERNKIAALIAEKVLWHQEQSARHIDDRNTIRAVADIYVSTILRLLADRIEQGNY